MERLLTWKQPGAHRWGDELMGFTSGTHRLTPNCVHETGPQSQTLGEHEELGSRTPSELYSHLANTGAQVGTVRELLGAQDSGP